jgi:hypothetical protein
LTLVVRGLLLMEWQSYNERFRDCRSVTELK